MNFINHLKAKYTTDMLLILAIIVSMFFPFYICGPLLLIEFLYLLYTKKAIYAFQNTPKIIYLLIFLGLSALVSLFYQNWVGILTVGGLFIAATLMVYYRQHITPELFELILDILIIFSVFWALYGLFEQMQILQRLGVDHFSLKVYSRRENRLNSVFFNANYYAMMLEFLIMTIFYKILTTKDKRKIIFYVLVGFLNLFMLYMTGCRTALIAIAGAMLVFLIINKNYKICSLIALAFLALLAFFAFNPDKFPRIERIVSNLDVRIKIWKCALEGIKHHPLFGQGPFTYVMIRDLYNGHLTQHAHSVYLDPLLSFGFLGLATLVPYLYDRVKRLWSVFHHNQQKSYIALTVSFIIIILLHGILDYTIMWIHTLLFFLLVASSYPMYSNIKKTIQHE